MGAPFETDTREEHYWRAALERVPPFRNVGQEDIKLELLGGALTNVSYKVTTGGAAYVLRLAGEGTSDI